MTYYIDTIEEFYTVRQELKPVYITSRTHGKIEVPCANTILVNRELIQANNYNPNAVPTDKMHLLTQSIVDNGFCFPVVTIFDDESEKFIIIDGFHRNTQGSEKWLDLDYIPLVFLKHNISQRMLATVQFNKARGVHQVDLDAELIRALIEQGLSEEEIADRLKIDLDTIHRYKALTGVAELFKNAQYSMSWDIVEQDENDENDENDG